MDTSRMPSARWLALAARLLGVAAAVVIIWLPELAHYHVDRSPVPADVVARHQAAPPDAVLDEAARYGPEIEIWLQESPDPLADAATQIARGRFVSRNLPEAALHEAPYPADLAQSVPTLQVAIAGFAVERVLLSAYARTGNSKYLQLAESRITAFAAYEGRQRWIGAEHWMLWNDHAIAARIGVLVQFWRHYRARPDARPEVKAAVLSLVNRSGQLLAKPAHFDVGSNHGVLQNVGLLQLSAAFPYLPQAAAWRKTAVERLLMQLPYYVSGEGFALDHSSGYHLWGVELLTKAARLLALQGQEPPPSLLQAVAKSRAVLEVLRRPDGSLPLIGDTAMKLGMGIPVLAPSGPITYAHPDSAPVASRFLPVSGYSIWWGGAARGREAASQVVVAWSKFGEPGHKHADEPSVHFWRGGMDWITATGYWPYGTAGRGQALGWDGSNAPHLAGEPPDSRRAVAARNAGASDDERLRFVEAVRSGPAGLEVARQVVYFDDSLAILDFVSAPANARVRTVWTIDPRARVLDGGAGLLQARGPRDDATLMLGFAGVPGVGPAVVRASRDPFAGWVVSYGVPVAANAVVIEQAGGRSMAAGVFVPVGGTALPRGSGVAIEAEPEPGKWSLSFPRSGSTYRITRTGNVLRGRVERGAERFETRAALTPVPGVGQAVQAIHDARAAALEQFPRRRFLAGYRERLAKVMLAVAAALEVLVIAGWVAFPRVGRRGWLGASLMVALGWSVLAVLCDVFYLRPS